jgi:hypothetical protein
MSAARATRAAQKFAEIACAKKSQFRELIQIACSLPGPLRQIFRLRRRANQWLLFARPALDRGALRDRHERWLRDAMDVLASHDE